MKNMSLKLSLPLVILLLSGYLLADRSAQEPNLGVRYVSIAKCLEGFKSAQEELQRMREAFSAKSERLMLREASNREKEGELMVMDPNSEEFAEARHQLQQDKLSLKQDEEFLADLVAQRQGELFLRAYKAIQKAAAELGAREGFSSIMFSPGDFSQMPMDMGALNSIESKDVLWANPNYDVTSSIVSILNGEG